MIKLFTPRSKIPKWFCEYEVTGKGHVRFGGYILCYKWKGKIVAKLLVGRSIIDVYNVVGSVYPKFTV